MSKNQTFTRKLRRWLKIVRREITRLTFQRDIFKEVTQDIIQKNPRIQIPSAFYSWMKNAYITDITIGIRRQVDTNKRTISFTNFLEELANNPRLITRRSFITKYKGSNVEMDANRDFDKFSKPGNPYIDSHKVKADLRKLSKLWEITEKYINKRIAHIDRHGVRKIPTFKDLDNCVDLLGTLLLKYLLLIEGEGLVQVMPTIQNDWKAIFREPWITPKESEMEISVQNSRDTIHNSAGK